MRRLLIATTNLGKQLEFRRLLADLPAEVVTPQEIGVELEIEEPFDTYEENARAKAVAYAEATSLLTLADDSGIEVAALGWGPGVRSARWGQGRNAERILEALGETKDRRARMVCALVIAHVEDGQLRMHAVRGDVEGTIARTPRGAGGFGYDPVFLLPSGVTTAELRDAEKDRVSHRGRAMIAARGALLDLLVARP
ncbi:MAG: non-canonical purine NTP pyrophosphatase [Candidatus Limnocylindria bacterium]